MPEMLHMRSRPEEEMRTHTTHFDDCGCRSEKYEKQLALQKEVIEALTNMVAQHCHDDSHPDWQLFSWALHANADAMRLLGKLGVIEIDDRGARMVFGRWPKEKLNEQK